MKKTIYMIFIIAATAAACAGSEGDMSRSSNRFNQLTPEEARVIVGKGTERAFTGEYWNFTGVGTYICRRCDAPLYRSSDKFESECGWPSFDAEIAGAVRRVPDADGMRTEIVCAACGGHLGHVFLGEGFTPKNTRHCVNSISMRFIPDAARYDTAIFAGGCFWGVEYFLQQVPGVLSVTSGYTGGNVDSPSYEEVCSGRTGHAEAVKVVFDSKAVGFESLARLFFEIHDPEQVDRQGPDVGEQYRSEIFYTSDEQKRIAEKLIGILRENGFSPATKVTKAGAFWDAEKYHQDYYFRKNSVPYCHARTDRFHGR